MSNDSPNSLLTRAWRGALVLFGTVVLLRVSVEIVARIWVWLVVIALTMVAVAVLGTLFMRWRDRNRW
jgi:ABC-type multidrug transport system permease subunit